MRIVRWVQTVVATVLTALLVMCGYPLHAQESPDDSLRTLHPAEGIEVSLWAHEPMVNNPTSMDIDSRGRVWIAEGLNYRMKQRTFDTLKRVDKADRIKVLSDTDGDGKADSVTVFADDIFPVPLGLAVEELWRDGKQTGTRVYVGNSPDLLVLEDTDGDDKADRRYALLTGFRGVDSDHGLHGMTFGPDGKLYFTVGDARYGADRVQSREKTFDVTDRSGRRLSCSNFGTTLRVNRDGTQLEVLSSGHRNNYEAAVDSFGNVFGSDNDDDGNRGARMYWVIDGGRYGYQHPDSSRHWAEELPGIIPKLVGTGNGAPGGLTVYEGDLLPEQYFGSVLQIDSGTRQVNAHALHRHGAGFRSDYEVLLKGDDSWFRPVDLAVAPDGSVLVCDWYDAGVGGNRFSDQTTGRIYRLHASASQKNVARFDGKDAVDALKSPNSATRLAARDALVSRGGEARRNLLSLFRDGRPHERARALHVLYELESTGIADTVAALSDPDARIRETALQLLARDTAGESVVEPDDARTAQPAATRFLDQILPLADDPDAGVHRALLMALRNVPTELGSGALKKLAMSWDGQDRYYLEALRAALLGRDSPYVQQLFDRLATGAIEAGWNEDPVAVPPYFPIGTNDAFLRPADRLPPSNAASRVIGLAWVLQRSESLPALTRILKENRSPTVQQAATIALAGIQDDAAGRLLMQRFSANEVDQEGKRQILRRLGVGVSGPWKGLANEDALRNVFTVALKDRSLQADAIGAIARCRLMAFGDPLMNLAVDDAIDDLIRAAAVSALGKLKHEPARTLVTELIDSARGKPSAGPIVQAALDASHAMFPEDSANVLMKTLTDSAMPLDVRRRSLQQVTASASGVDRVLSLRKQKSFPADLESELTFLLHNHADRRVRNTAASVMPINTKAGKKIHSAQTVLALQGSATRGRELFETHKEAACARCHHVTGEGPLVGPDLASIGMKYGDKELLYHLQNPSGAINYSFVAHTFLLADGRVLSGLVVDRKAGQVTIGIATGQYVTFDESDVDSEKQQSTSLMPEGLVANFTTQQLSDLVEYLLTLRQGDAIRAVSGQEAEQEIQEFSAAICAHHLCSGLWVVGRSYQRTPEEVIAQDIAPFKYFGWQSAFKYEVDEERRLVTVTAPGAPPRSARYTGDQGSTILPRGNKDVFFKPVPVPRGLPDAAKQPWPLGDVGATEPVPAGVDVEAVAAALDWAMEQKEQNTRAFVVAYDGKIIGQRYAPGWTKDTPQISWSQGKSITATLIAILVQRGLLKIDQPAPLKEWQGAGDPRREIRIRDLLQMSSGLDFINLGFKGPESLITKNEHMRVYFDSLNVLEHAVNQPLKVPPGTRYSYLNSDPLSLGKIVRDTVEAQGEDYLTFPQRALFDRIGARNYVLETDAWGNFILSGYDYGSARDWVRFGLLYLNDGVWQGERILPEGWTKFVATPAPADEKENYGGMFWLNRPPRMDQVPKDAYWSAGFMGQVTMIIPSRKLVVVRMGPSPGDVYPNLNETIGRVLKAIP